MSEQVTQSPESDPNWSRRIGIGVVLIVGLTLIGLLGAAFLPRWWAQRIGDQVSGSITTGGFLGLFYGFVFTLLPLIVLFLVFRYLRTWRRRAIGVSVVILLAAPNLLTLGIVLGTGNGAHAGDRILDVEAPAFRGGTLAGALLAVAFVTGAWYLVRSRRRAWSRADTLESASPRTESTGS
ncbi:MAG: permease [Gaiellaceae bacterium]